jgi:hypothetical protein
MIAIVIGFAGLFSIDYFLFKFIYGYVFIFLGAFMLASYDFLRIKYWTYYALMATFLSQKQATKLFNDYNSKVECSDPEKAPVSCACILKIAIKCQLRKLANGKDEYWLSRQTLKIVLKTGD